jgi:hypothetical protein
MILSSSRGVWQAGTSEAKVFERQIQSTLDGSARASHGVAMLIRSLLLLGFLGVGAQDQPPTIPLPVLETENTTNFVFASVRLRSHGDDLRLSGSLCRRPNRSVMSASRAEIDRLSATGELLATSYAYLPRLSQREDQRCGSFGATLKALPMPVDRIRVCIAQGRGPCRALR